MAKNAIFTVSYRRKREGKTHFKKRLELLKSERVRLVIRRSNTAILVQFVEYQPDGDKVLLTFNSKKLETYGWKFSKSSVPASYLAGFAAGKLALQKKISDAILDLGLQTPLKGSRLYAALKGVVDAGVKVPCSDDIFPSDERIKGQHIATMGDEASRCTSYQKAKLDVKSLPDTFEAVKKKINA